VATYVEYSVGRSWDTLNAWSELTVVTIRNPNQEYLGDAELRAGDDAIDAKWFTVSEAAPLAEIGQFSKTSLKLMQLHEASIRPQA
jgi:hypothetical protein